jgi:superfamily II DNA/RNA helicase
MYTATWPKEVRKIAGNLLVDPVQVNNVNTDELAANKSITQPQFMGTSLKVNGTSSFFSFRQGRLLSLLPLMWLHEGLTLQTSG